MLVRELETKSVVFEFDDDGHSICEVSFLPTGQ